MDKLREHKRLPRITGLLGSLFFISLFFVSTTGIVAQAQQTHPFLVVNQSDYQELKDRSSQSPWKDMKEEAILNATTLSYDPNLPNVNQKVRRIREMVSSAALAYILDPANKTTYMATFMDAVNAWPSILGQLNCSSWSNNVPPGFAFFNSVLTLDIMHDDLVATGNYDVAFANLDQVGEWYWARSNCAWPENFYAVRGIWALYEGNQTRIDSAVANYKSTITDEMTGAGIFYQGTGYAQSRLGADNDAKAYFMDVLTHLSMHDYYNNPQFQIFNEWLFSGAHTPLRHKVTFGDTDPEQWGGRAEAPANYRAHRFSQQAAKNAAWFVQNDPIPKGRLLNYVLMDQPLPAPESPKSTIWPDAQASFWENNNSIHTLMGALWSPSRHGQDFGHSHKDVNAIHISAYGEDVMRNIGYAGWGNATGCASNNWTWNQVNGSAFPNNTVVIDAIDHASKLGGGIVEGFVSGTLDYASGDSGPALPNGKHTRNLVLVHPQDGKNGYFVLFDEITGDSGSTNARVLIHANSDIAPTVTNDTEYQWVIHGNQYTSGNAVGIAAFLATPQDANKTTIKNGCLSTRSVDDTTGTAYPDILGKYIDSTYSLLNSKKNVVTLLFPYDTHHQKATMTRISGTYYSGATVDLGGGVIDTAMESDGFSSVSIGVVSFQGNALLYRETSGKVPSYFVRKGLSFNDGAEIRYGFDSNNPVSLYMKNSKGNIVSSGGDVTFYYLDITGVKLNGSPLSPLTTTPHLCKVAIPAGSHTIELISPQLTLLTCPGDVNQDTNRDLSDAIRCIRHLLGLETLTGNELAAADSNQDGSVDLSDVIRLIRDLLGLEPLPVCQ